MSLHRNSILGALAALLAAVAIGAVARAGGSEAPRRAERPAAMEPPAAFTEAAGAGGTLARAAADAAARPDDPDALVNLALAELQRAREDADPSWYGRADALLERALRLRPDDPAALAARGSVALSRHRFADGLRLGRQALAVEPSSAAAMGVVVDGLVELGRYDAARRAVQRMLDARPDLASYSRASYVLELGGRVEAARRVMELAVESGSVAPENVAWTQVQLANLDLGQGRVASAERIYRRALETLPGFVPARAGLARAAAARGRLSRAAAELERIVARVPALEYVLALADVRAAMGDRAGLARARELVRVETRLLAAAGVVADAELALFESDHGDPRRAVPLARRAAADLDSVTVDDSLAWSLFRAGHAREALAAADRALRLGTRNATLLYHRGAIRAALGMRAGARRDLAAALAVNPRFSPLHAPEARRLLARLGG